MGDLQRLFPEWAALNPATAEAERAEFAGIPGKGAVYLLVAEEGGVEVPVLLATVGDLRGALRRRLADTPAEVKSKRVAYGAICTRVYYRVIHSAFAANFYYAEAARALFPETVAALIPWRTSWWVAVERGELVSLHPRFRKTNNLGDAGLAYAGPIRDKHAAGRLVESLEDLFDLCRYHNILVQAPRGRACAYKEMGKCGAPCDGSVSLEAYREQVQAALGYLSNAPGAREGFRAELEGQMKAAAGQLQFEAAAKIKQRLSRAGLLGTEPFAVTGPLEEFAFLSLQPGKGKPWVEPWVVHFGREPGIEAWPQFNVKEVAEAAAKIAGRVAELPACPRALTAEQSEGAALVAHHLFRGEADHGVWVRVSEVRERGAAAVVEAVERLRAKKAPKPMVEQSTDAQPEAVTTAETQADAEGEKS
ncbi:MAG TPA: hypothetical protein VHM90_10510 [Phycisphaerae bacterium]|nr:hypothetical protein [Phycisphaerae bacterium]